MDSSRTMPTVGRTLVATVLIALGPGADLAGQAPDSTGQPPPPPTAEDLAVYAIAVDSAAFPDEDVVVLLDEGSVRVEKDGTSTSTFRIIRQVRSDASARALAELSYRYDSGRETLVLDWARVLEPDGTIVSGPVHVQLLDAPVGRSSPIYTDGKVVRASLGAVDEGRIVDVQYTRTVTDPALPGDYLQAWGVNGGQPVLRSRFALDTPAELEPRIAERNLPGPPRVTRSGDRVTREWAYEALDPVESELFAADSNSLHMGLTAAGSVTWNEIATWYVDLTKDRHTVTPELERAFAGAVEGAATQADSLRALHRWVAQDIRYLSLSLGLGGYQPRTTEEVVRTGAGDCKDKTTLFVALARHLGIEAHPVLVRTAGEVNPDLPSIRQFNHMIAAIRWGDGWHYLDLTVPVAPFDEVFGGLQGKTGVMLLPDGTAEVVTFPQRPAAENRSSIVIEGELTEDGTLHAEYTEVVTGALQYRIRGEFARPFNERRMQGLRQNLANRVGRGGVTDSVEIFDGLDLETTPRLWARVNVADILEEVPGGWLLPVSLTTYATPATLERLEAEGERRFPLDAAKVFGLREHHTEYRIVLPQGWSADLPERVTAQSPFGSYESVFEQDGRELRILRVMRGTDTVLPPDAKEELMAWLRILADDHVEHVVLRGLR